MAWRCEEDSISVNNNNLTWMSVFKRYRQTRTSKDHPAGESRVTRVAEDGYHVWYW